jgi:hypothetical protein
MTVHTAQHGTVNGTDLVEFDDRRHSVVVTNMGSDPLWGAFDDDNGATAGDDELFVVLPSAGPASGVRTFNVSCRSVSLYSDASVEYNVEGN